MDRKLNPRETYLIAVRATGPGAPIRSRLNHFLKSLLRSAGLRCVWVDEEERALEAAARKRDARSA